MLLLRRFLLVGCLLLTGVVLGCSSKPQPMKNGARTSSGSEAAKPIPINPWNKKKFLQPEPDSPPAPPVGR